MKLLLFTYEFPPVPGGIGRYCATLSKTLLKLGHEVVVVIPRLIRGSSSVITDAEVECFEFYRSPMRPFLDAVRLYRATKTHRPDYVLSTHGFSFVPVGLLSFLSRFPYAVTVIGSDIKRQPHVAGPLANLKKTFFERALVRAQKLICISQYSKQLLESTFSVRPDKV